MRQPRTRNRRDAFQQALQNAAHGGRAEQQRFLPAAEVKEPVGEDVAALEIGGELNLIDGDEGGIGLARHRLDGADRISCARRPNLFLAGNQRDLVGADLLANARIDLAGKKPQRQADDAAFMRNHALDGEMCLAGVGRAEHSGHVAPRLIQRFGVLGMKGHWFRTWPL